MTSDLIFSELATNFSKTLSSLKRSNLSISNRLRSITEDSEFVLSVAEAYELPLVANERCGSWYIPPEKKIGSAYFKSTDGHTGQWSFNTRRLNLHLLDLVAEHYGCVIVDSTRRGKSMPDALSKTIPIWCTVINMSLFPDITESHKFHVPPKVISQSEKSQIEDRLSGFLEQFQSLRVDMTGIRQKLTKPLRPIWMTRDSILPGEVPSFGEFYPLVLCTSSRCVLGAELSEGGYIQGAGDDCESWSHGLTPQNFWKNRDILLSAAEKELSDLIRDLIQTEAQSPTEFHFVNVKSAPQLLFGSSSLIMDLALPENHFLISCGMKLPKILSKTRHLHLQCREGKLGSRDLRTKLSDILTFFPPNVAVCRLYIVCSDGKDLSIGIGLAVLCLFFNDQGIFTPWNGGENVQYITKAFIRQRLTWITTSILQASPSRATLQSVNDFLFSSMNRSSELNM